VVGGFVLGWSSKRQSTFLLLLTLAYLVAGEWLEWSLIDESSPLVRVGDNLFQFSQNNCFTDEFLKNIVDIYANYSIDEGPKTFFKVAHTARFTSLFFAAGFLLFAFVGPARPGAGKRQYDYDPRKQV
jgi:hypothetical protein